MKGWAFLLSIPLFAHVMSMSTGDIAVQGNRAHYELRMPVYEIAHVKNPETSLFEHIRFSTAGQSGRLTQKSCREDMSQGSYVCSADFEFPIPVDRLGVGCTFLTASGPNHLHLLPGPKDGNRDPATFGFFMFKL